MKIFSLSDILEQKFSIYIVRETQDSVVVYATNAPGLRSD